MGLGMEPKIIKQHRSETIRNLSILNFNTVRSLPEAAVEGWKTKLGAWDEAKEDSCKYC